ncbi:signal recognition particle-docking protein FtsY [Jiella sp. MQZ9-1]|uniref:Signal recognition particle receptor FtsY n=1 Tax=Jiella flava TaxID=2816857 RepID=A0A939FVM8_9HYPH|nr:signal recognition particle-docking protein FtsY [Jiella flava]MBO0661000.1 signal recognition particle-docking protein FtsY [Jiella flava]MCD2469648.1 signal recognition particle-docking protein FtsY [Jiella flava]
MAETKSFLRKIFSFGPSSEAERPPEHGTTPRPAEIEGGGITPPSEREASPTASAELPAAGEAQKKTLSSQEPLDLDPPDEPLAPHHPIEAEDEPDTDFSFLDDPAPMAESEADFSFLDEQVEPVESATREPSAVADAVSPSVEPAGDDDHIGVEPAEPGTADDLGDGLGDDNNDDGADFSWLDEDLPPEEDDTPATRPSDAAPARAPLPDDSGFRLRERPTETVALTAAPKVSWVERLRQGLSRSSTQLTGSITSLFTKRRLDEDTLQDFEDVLIQADLGVETATRITDRLSDGRFGREIAGSEVRRILAEEIEKALDPVAQPLELDLEKKPHVILVVGVNGTGKTTTIGKLAAKLTRAGLKVTLCAGDTFRAAAVEQLKIWGERTGSEVVAKQIGADAAGLAFEAYDRAVENDSDVLIIDTAGRLQNKAELMAELEKINRVLAKREPDAPHTVLQTLDATTGQNALSQVEIFRNVSGVNGLVMTKLDGSARGGILVAIAAKHRLPVYFVGVGEGIDDLEPFKAKDFASAIAGTPLS